ncbi:MAG: response regulator [Methylacidiphilales bacterium]|nr:response regulator [Candidatus Methylacidiphilales bacterium]
MSTPNQSGSLRRPIVLRPPGQLITEKNVRATGSLPPSGAETELKNLREELANCHKSLEQWTQAEVEWSQQRRLFQIMTENVSDLIVLLDHEGKRTWNNPAFGHLLGYSPEELTGTHALAEVHPDDQARATEALNQTLRDGSTEQAEFRMQKKDGAWVNLQAETIGVLDPAGHVESVVLLAVDMTEKMKLSEALALASTEATAAGVVKGMAHDFDQILTNVIGNLTIAKNLNGPHNAIAVRLNEMERALQRARDLIEQVFSITPDAGHPKIRLALEPAVQEAVTTVLRGTMIRAEYLFPRNLPDVEVEQEGFLHAVRNIVTNSVEAMDKGVVRFSAENIPQAQFSYRPDLPLKAGDYVCLHIQDQGHGISEKALARVFEPYFTTRSGSQGLGLTTALSSIQRMGGTILIDSTPGVGTTISLYLPAVSGKSATGPLPTKSGSLARAVTLPSPGSRTGHTGGLPKLTHTSAMPTPAHKRRILLMDDEQMILDIVSRMLSHLGYEVTTCTDGAQAIAAFAKSKSHSEPFDVVMMDLVIPNGVGGQDAVHTIKKIDPSAKVIASSGHLDHPVMKEHKKFGFNATLEKPYKLEKLRQVIEAVINAPAA